MAAKDNSTCITCPSGTFNAEVGATSSMACYECPAGTFSGVGTFFFVQTYRYDGEVTLGDINHQTRLDLLRLGPFGMGNPQPKLLVRNVQPKYVEVKGATGRLLKFKFSTPQGPLVEAIWWGQAEQEQILNSNKVDLLGSLQVNRWQGRETLQFKIDDARIANDVT